MLIIAETISQKRSLGAGKVRGIKHRYMHKRFVETTISHPNLYAVPISDLTFRHRRFCALLCLFVSTPPYSHYDRSRSTLRLSRAIPTPSLRQVSAPNLCHLQNHLTAPSPICPPRHPSINTSLSLREFHIISTPTFPSVIFPPSFLPFSVSQLHKKFKDFPGSIQKSDNVV